MTNPVYVFDPTSGDSLSRVRGIGRYLQTLHENFSEEFTFVDRVHKIARHSIFINPFFNFLAPPLIMRRVAKRQVAVIHDIIPLKYPRHFPVGIKGSVTIFLNKLALRLYDLIITDSEASKHDIVRHLGIDEQLIRVVYPTISTAYFQADNESDDKLPENLQPNSYYIYVGDATWNKNLLNIAKAVRKADVTCVFVGKIFSKTPTELSTHPWTRELHDFRTFVDNDKRFIFPGFIDDGTLRTLYRNAVANILVSRDEGFGLSYVEAAACKTPTIAADTPVQVEIAQDGALFADPENVDSIAATIRTTQTDPDRLKTLASAAAKRSLFFQPSTFKRTYLAAIREANN